jgi:hypothetical protein
LERGRRMGGAFRTRAAAGAAVRTLIFEVNQTTAAPRNGKNSEMVPQTCSRPLAANCRRLQNGFTG